MAKMMFFPLGNADSTLIHLSDDRLLLLDYCNHPPEGDADKRIRLDEELHSYLLGQDRNDFDLVAFTHADDDHLHGAEDFFWFDHAKKYQGDARVLIRTLAVPACFILEKNLENSGRVIQDEAKYRFKNGVGILVFGNPEPLREWLESEGVNPDTRTHLIVSAGSLLPGFSKAKGQVEIFIHSPFSFRMEGELVDRNGNCIVLHITFIEGDREFTCILGSDAEHQAWADMIYITTKNGNEKRLDWGLFRISHHCSYTALSQDKGKDITVPRAEVASLFERGEENSLLIASCNPIPSIDTDQPPHRQAAAFYKKVAKEFGSADNFVVTMEWPPKSDKPAPIVVEVTSNGYKLQKDVTSIGGAPAILSRPSPRFG